MSDCYALFRQTPGKSPLSVLDVKLAFHYRTRPSPPLLAINAAGIMKYSPLSSADRDLRHVHR